MFTLIQLSKTHGEERAKTSEKQNFPDTFTNYRGSIGLKQVIDQDSQPPVDQYTELNIVENEVNPLQSGIAYLYPLKTENLQVFCFQGRIGKQRQAVVG